MLCEPFAPSAMCEGTVVAVGGSTEGLSVASYLYSVIIIKKARAREFDDWRRSPLLVDFISGHETCVDDERDFKVALLKVNALGLTTLQTWTALS